MQCHLGDILSVDQNSSGVHIVESGDQIDDSALAGSGRSYQSHTLSRFHRKGEIVQHCLIRFIAEGNVIKGDLTLDRFHLHCIRCITYHHRLIQCLKDSLQISNIIDEVVEDIAQVHNRLPESGGVGRNRHNGTEACISRAEDHQSEDKDGCSHTHGDIIDSGPYQVAVGAAASVRQFAEGLQIFLFPGKDLGDLGADDILLQISV